MSEFKFLSDSDRHAFPRAATVGFFLGGEKVSNGEGLKGDYGIQFDIKKWNDSFSEECRKKQMYVS